MTPPNAPPQANASPQRDKAVAFTKREQVCEIISEANRLKLQVLMRTSNDGRAVRGMIEHVEIADGGIRIGSISPAGDELLKGQDFIKVEFILLSKKLVFVARVRARATGKILLAVPDKLVAIERRNNVRFRVPSTHAAFIELPDRKIDLARFDAPFVPYFLRDDVHSSARLRVDDVSLGGVACFTRFSAVSDLLRADEEGLMATVYFPNSSPVQVPVSVRWTKKTSANIPMGKFDMLQRFLASRIRSGNISEPFQMKETYFRIGIQFSEVSKDLDSTLRTFIRLVQTAESV